MKSFKAFTQQEIGFIKDNYKVISIAEISSKLDRPIPSVKYRIRKLDEDRLYNMWTETDKQFLLDNYKNYTYKKIADIVGKTEKSVRDKANYIGLYKLTNEKGFRGNEEITCTICKSKLENNKENFPVRRSKDGKVTDSICRKCAKLRRDTRYSNIEEFCRTLCNASKIGAVARKFPYTITKQDVIDKYNEQKGLCAITGITLTHLRGKGRVFTNISVDRIDSKKGYTKDNIQIVCFWANLAKQEMSTDQFHSFVKTTYENIFKLQ